MAYARSGKQLSGGIDLDAIMAYGMDESGKLERSGAQEDQIRRPCKVLLTRVATRFGLDAVAYGEVHLKETHARPAYADEVGSGRIAHLEVKAPNRNAQEAPYWRPGKRERGRWEHMSVLPDLVNTDNTSRVWVLKVTSDGYTSPR